MDDTSGLSTHNSGLVSFVFAGAWAGSLEILVEVTHALLAAPTHEPKVMIRTYGPGKTKTAGLG